MESSILADVHIRPIHPCDNVHELTLLLNRAYQKLTTKGLRYLAATQNVATTQKRIEKGQCYVAIYNNQLIGTIPIILRIKETAILGINKPLLPSTDSSRWSLLFSTLVWV